MKINRRTSFIFLSLFKLSSTYLLSVTCLLTLWILLVEIVYIATGLILGAFFKQTTLLGLFRNIFVGSLFVMVILVNSILLAKLCWCKVEPFQTWLKKSASRTLIVFTLLIPAIFLVMFLGVGIAMTLGYKVLV
jgi:hypothetical protein